MAGLRSIFLRKVMRDRRGAALVEFALVAPVFILALIGLFDLSYNIYTASLLEGAIQKAARDSTIEGADLSEAQIDARVTEVVHNIVPSGTVEFERKAYTNFADVARPEDFTDSNGDGVCNDGEPFEDVNGNGMWDEDRGKDGMGGARDAVLYVVTVTYDRQFPLHKFIGVPSEVSSVARTVLRNQPFRMQNTEVTVGQC
ncbi:pilus assembly protein [Altererythrobacter sp. KTW20L]|uniref:TadE/TadG family type IV pilus assembly protein n=1 Tax=Altererythrobacter sp. KTW20L TaxID=2942210 RepID=UPI0020C036FA|nr:TadE/TadG family type IV pilus assembly protein [Altererythrobacter sp. KTW20L]MCL6251970.1 pilus assembly protein [Altererythrobacter sp. KTW20L]